MESRAVLIDHDSHFIFGAPIFFKHIFEFFLSFNRCIYYPPIDERWITTDTHFLNLNTVTLLPAVHAFTPFHLEFSSVPHFPDTSNFLESISFTQRLAFPSTVGYV